MKSTRSRIIEAANQLFYQRGYEQTSFSNIAEAVRISRGNFYHHFKSKDEILSAVIDLRMKNTQKMLTDWAQETTLPIDRVCSFFNMLIANREPLMSYGCPVGSLCSELARLNHGSQLEASRLMVLFREWLSEQLRLLGFNDEAEALAMHLLVCSQGIATLANTFKDETFIRREVEFLNAWLDAKLQALHAQRQAKQGVIF